MFGFLSGSSRPVEVKVAAGHTVTVVVGVLTWILVTYVPAFHSGLPAPLVAFLPMIIGWILGAAAGWLAPHTPSVVTPPPAPPAASVSVTKTVAAVPPVTGLTGARPPEAPAA